MCAYYEDFQTPQTNLIIGWRSWRTHFVNIFDLRKNASDKFAFGVRMFLGPPAKVKIPWYVKWLCWGSLFQDSLTCLEWHCCVHILVSRCCVKEQCTTFKQACLLSEYGFALPLVGKLHNLLVEKLETRTYDWISKLTTFRMFCSKNII